MDPDDETHNLVRAYEGRQATSTLLRRLRKEHTGRTTTHTATDPHRRSGYKHGGRGHEYPQCVRPTTVLIMDTRCTPVTVTVGPCPRVPMSIRRRSPCVGREMTPRSPPISASDHPLRPLEAQEVDEGCPGRPSALLGRRQEWPWPWSWPWRCRRGAGRDSGRKATGPGSLRSGSVRGRLVPSRSPDRAPRGDDGPTVHDAGETPEDGPTAPGRGRTGTKRQGVPVCAPVARDSRAPTAGPPQTGHGGGVRRNSGER